LRIKQATNRRWSVSFSTGRERAEHAGISVATRGAIAERVVDDEVTTQRAEHASLGAACFRRSGDLGPIDSTGSAKPPPVAIDMASAPQTGSCSFV
jgi:hypothetical protein